MKVIPRTILGISQLLLLIMAASALSAQAQTVAGSSRTVPAASLSTNQTATSQNLGSVPSGTATSEVLGLTLRDAIARAVRYNLGVIETGENARNARGQRLIALSGLLPHVTASATQTVNQISLVPSGISRARIPGVSFPAVIIYLQVIEATSRITAQEAQVRNAQASYDQALRQFEAGTAPRIDVTRTQVQLRTEQYSLSVTRNNFSIAKLTLSRAIGLPLGQPFQIADELPYADISPPSVDEALRLAFKTRSDSLSARAAQKAAERALSAARAERYPVAATKGNYSAVGSTFGQSRGTFTFQAGISIPVFTGGQIAGDITQAEAALRQRSAEAENICGQIDYDVRTAFFNLNAAVEQVAVTRQNVDLANETLSRSKDRFAAGVTDSVEVVQSEQSLASANDQYITALYNHNVAKLSLAHSLGVARTDYSQYLGGK